MTNLIVVDIFFCRFFEVTLETLGCKSKHFTDNTPYKMTDENIFVSGCIDQSIA